MGRSMFSTSAFKAAFIGTHGVGKTTLCYGLAAGLKARDVNLEVVREVARRCPLPINQATNVAAQSWILHTQIAEELVAAAHYSAVICDRSVLDNYVYLLLAAGPQADLEPLVDRWMTTYDLLVHVPVVHEPAADGIRATDPHFQSAIEFRLLEELRHRNLPVVYLDGEARNGWLDRVIELVLDRLRPPQLQLL
jgi:nicotinamide riboside kinase